VCAVVATLFVGAFGGFDTSLAVALLVVAAMIGFIEGLTLLPPGDPHCHGTVPDRPVLVVRDFAVLPDRGLRTRSRSARHTSDT